MTRSQQLRVKAWELAIKRVGAADWNSAERVAQEAKRILVFLETGQ